MTADGLHCGGAAACSAADPVRDARTAVAPRLWPKMEPRPELSTVSWDLSTPARCSLCSAPLSSRRRACTARLRSPLS